MAGKDIIFFIFAAMTIGSAAIVVFSKKITYAAFALMLSLFGVAGLYVFLGADFIAAVQLIIYVGGILILLLFGVLLTVKIYDVNVTTRPKQRWIGGASVGLFFFLLLFAIFNRTWRLLDEESMVTQPQSMEIGNKLMTEYLLPFEVASVLLLVALIGAMFLVRTENK
jgi:NADH-quinone oxidoreductase subunit J